MERNLIMLGTGHAMVTRCYNTCFCIQNAEDYLLVDAGGGNGILSRLEEAQIPVEKIHCMFVTHSHTDHVLGVVWMIRKVATMMRGGSYEGKFKIYCHEELADTITQLCMLTLVKKFTSFLGDRILIKKVKDGEEKNAAGMKLTFFDIHSTKIKQFGFRAGFEDGTRLTCLGDEPYKETARPYAEGCDWLLSEAFCLDRDKEIFHPYEKHHSTALDAGRLAQQLHVKNMVLYHTEDTCLSERKESYTKEAARCFDGNIFVPLDLERIRL